MPALYLFTLSQQTSCVNKHHAVFCANCCRRGLQHPELLSTPSKTASFRNYWPLLLLCSHPNQVFKVNCRRSQLLDLWPLLLGQAANHRRASISPLKRRLMIPPASPADEVATASLTTAAVLPAAERAACSSYPSPYCSSTGMTGQHRVCHTGKRCKWRAV
jgi:hypothetical protein